MTEPNNQHQVTVPLTVDSSFGADFDRSYMADVASDVIHNSRGEFTITGEDASIQLSHQGISYSGTSDNSDSEHTETDVSLTDSSYGCMFNCICSESTHSTPAFLLRLLTIFSCCFGDNKSAPVHSAWYILPGVSGEVHAAVEDYIAGWQLCYETFLRRELPMDVENNIRQELPNWNRCLQRKQGVRGTSAIISSDIEEDIHNYIVFNIIMGEQWTENNEKWIIRWLQHWNKFLQARAGETLVTGCDLFFTVIGLILYLLDLVSDFVTFIIYAYSGKWWQAILTLVLVYGTIIIHTVTKWLNGQIHCTGSADWLRYISSLFVNWPDVKQYGVLCRLEWKLYKSPEKYAHLIPEWHERRVRLAYLKFMEGICEACPQAILQLCLLASDLYGDLAWTDYLRILCTCLSLCTAGAALTNFEKRNRIGNHIDLPKCELVVLHVWAVPVTVSRLLSVALLLTVEPYWGLAGVALHFILCSVYGCRTNPRELIHVLGICLATLLFFISPFNITESITYRRVVHVIHILGNTVATVVWALGTPLASSHPALITAIICFNAVMFALGLLGWVLHEKYWRQ